MEPPGGERHQISRSTDAEYQLSAVSDSTKFASPDSIFRSRSANCSLMLRRRLDRGGVS